MAKLSRGPGDDRGPVVWMHGNGTVTDVTYQGVSLRNWITGVALKSAPDRMTMVDLSLVIRANPQYRWPQWMVKQAGELP